MRLSAVAALMILTTVLLSACQQEQTAALDDKGRNFYGRYSTVAMTTPAYTDSVSAAPLAPSFSSTSSGTPFAKAAPRWAWPVEGNVTERFGTQANGIASEGITIAAAEGAPIHAAAGGEVAYVGLNVRDYGNMVILRHPTGELTSYAHAGQIVVHKGDVVIQGETLGYVGRSGSAKTPQLHFALRQGDRAIDPLTKLPSQMASR